MDAGAQQQVTGTGSTSAADDGARRPDGPSTPAGYEITIADTGERFVCRDGQNVLAAMEKLGRKGIPVGCRGGGCGVCRVQVLGTGSFRTLRMSRAQVSEADEARGICLACKLVPEGPLELRPLGPWTKVLT